MCQRIVGKVVWNRCFVSSKTKCGLPLERSRAMAAAAPTTQLVRQLVAQTRAAKPPPAATPSSTETADANLLFEDEVDGVRCLLIRVAPTEKPPIKLSPREQEIVRLVSKGYPNKVVANVLEISTWTVG